MRAWMKWAVAVAAPLMLVGCLWTPGKFASELQIRKNGTFTLDYRGEIMMQLPKDAAGGSPPTAWSDKFAQCETGGKAIVEVAPPIVGASGGPEPKANQRSCTPAEIAKLRSDYERQQADRAASQRKESEQMAKMFGLPGDDDESNRRFAATLMKYQGWRSVRYVGKGVFDVDYHFDGRVGQDYAFPMMPDADFIIPFITVRQRTDGAVLATAPALTGGGKPFAARAMAMGLPDKGDGPKSRASGVFAIVTDGEILTNNSEDGPTAAPAGKRVTWDVGPGSTKVPELLVRL